jgi:hypothetical protein
MTEFFVFPSSKVITLELPKIHIFFENSYKNWLLARKNSEKDYSTTKIYLKRCFIAI